MGDVVCLVRGMKELVDEIRRAEKLIERYAGCYHLHESDCPAGFKMVMFFNDWHSPFVALNELLKIIDKDEMLIKRAMKEGAVIAYKSRYKEMLRLIQEAADGIPVEVEG